MNDSRAGKVLLAIDGSVAADRAAAYIARNAGALGIREVDILTVQSVPSYHTHAEPGSPIPLDVIEFGKEVAAKASRLLDKGNVRHRLATQLGEPASTIVHTATEDGLGEIVMGSRGLSQLAGVVMGSVAYKVIHLSTSQATHVFGARHTGNKVSTASAIRMVVVNGWRCG